MYFMLALLYISSCLWKGEPCDPSDFKVTLHGQGLCYTFNHDVTKPKRCSQNNTQETSVLLGLENLKFDGLQVAMAPFGLALLPGPGHGITTLKKPSCEWDWKI